MDDWKEDGYQQVKHCSVCHQPILLAEHSLEGMYQRDNSLWEWNERRTCSKECKYKWLAMRYEAKRVDWCRATFNSLVSDFRAALGFDAADTESTFSPWDFAMIERVEGYQDLEEWDSLMEHIFTLKMSILCNIIHGGSVYSVAKNYYNRKRGRDAKTSFHLLTIFFKVYPREMRSAPLWHLSGKTKSEMTKAGFNVDHLPKTLLFNRISEELYGGEMPTFNQWKNMCKQEEHERLYQEHDWYPSPKCLFYQKKHYSKIWYFVLEYRRHINRDTQGRFLSAPFKRMDCLVHQTRKHSDYCRYALEWSKTDMKEWFFDYLCGYYRIVLDKETFPYEASQQELEQIINLRIAELENVVGYHSISSQSKTAGRCVRVLVQELWPDYPMTQNLWNRMLLSEKRMSTMLENVLRYFGYDCEYSEATPIPTEDGKARYNHSNAPMKVDFLCRQLGFIIEGQGDYHFMKDNEIIERQLTGAYIESLFWDRKIPVCYDGEETTQLGYRQFLDREKRVAIEAIGFTPIYVILAENAYPVEGVHGEIPIWNRHYVNEASRPDRHKYGGRERGIGLAETCDLQDRTDIGDMVREYYREVIL